LRVTALSRRGFLMHAGASCVEVAEAMGAEHKQLATGNGSSFNNVRNPVTSSPSQWPLPQAAPLQRGATLWVITALRGAVAHVLVVTMAMGDVVVRPVLAGLKSTLVAGLHLTVIREHKGVLTQMAMVLRRRPSCQCFTVGFSEGYPEESDYE